MISFSSSFDILSNFKPKDEKQLYQMYMVVFYIFLSVMTHNSMIIPASILLFCYISFVLRQIKIVFAVLLALMLIFHQYACSMRRAHLKPGCIPESRLIVLNYIFSITYFSGG